MIETLARADGSVAWCASIAAAYSRFSGYLPEPVARRILWRRAIVAGGLAPSGKARPVPGGYSVSGRWAYGSGILHAHWVLGGCVVQADGGPRRGADGAPEIRTAFFPASAAAVIDTWQVGGLRGTGSQDYQVTDLFVPEDHTVTGNEPLLPGPLYAVSRHTAYPVAIAAVPLGVAHAALDAFQALAAGKTPVISPALLRDRPVVQAGVGRAEAQLRAARAFLLETCDMVWDAAAAGGALSLEQRALKRLACAQAAEAAKAVVQLLYDAGGGSSVYERCPLQRCFRDVHAAAQHLQVHSAKFETGGRVLLGFDPGTVHL